MPATPSDASAQVDAYLASVPPQFQELCSRLRQIIRNAHPDLQEDWKWGPHYSCQGMVCGWSAFKEHAKITFFNGAAMTDSAGLFNHCTENEFSRSIKLIPAAALQEELLTSYIRESVAINQNGFKRLVKNKELSVPEDLLAALANHPEALRFFELLSYGYQKEYTGWIVSAKRPQTRAERIQKTIVKCAAGQKLNDKYKK